MLTAMTIHGFRVYEISLRECLGRKPVAWDIGPFTHYRDHILKNFGVLTSGTLAPLLAAKTKWSEVSGMTAIVPADSVALGDRCVRFLSAENHGQRLSVRLMYGVGGNFTHSIGPSGDNPIGDQAAAREYRAEILMPDDADTPGLLVLETISRSAPASSLVYWMGAASRVSQLNDGSSKWWRLKYKQVSDPTYLDELIDRTKKASVTVRRKDQDGTGNRLRVMYQLKAALQHSTRADARNWAKQSKRNSGGLLELIGVSDPGDMSFNDGFLALDDGEATTRIGLSDARDTFTYPISELRPSPEAWDEKVKKRVKVIQPTLQW